MNEIQFVRMRRRFSAAVTFGIWGLLGWKHFHGGVPVHHLLHRGDLPGISCWWDGFLLPALAWFLVGRMRPRLVKEGGIPGLDLATIQVLRAWAGALVFGAVLGWSALQASPMAASAPALLLLLGLCFPIYRAECVLGFVVGMTSALGSVLPLIFASLFAGVGAVMYLGVRPFLLRVGRWVLGD